MVMSNVNVIEYLQSVLNFNTKHYKIDFLSDIKCLLEASTSEDAEDKYFFWLSRECGTLLTSVRDVFMDTAARTSFLYYQDTPDVMVYAICINGKSGPDLLGNVARIKYHKFCRYTLQEICFAPVSVEVKYLNGDVELYSKDVWHNNSDELTHQRIRKTVTYLPFGEDVRSLQECVSKTVASFFDKDANGTLDKEMVYPPTIASATEKMDIYEFRSNDENASVYRFRVDSHMLSEKDYVLRALELAATEFCTTLKGQQLIKGCGTFTYKDIWQKIPDSYLKKYGLQKDNGRTYEVEIDRKESPIEAGRMKLAQAKETGDWLPVWYIMVANHGFVSIPAKTEKEALKTARLMRRETFN